MSDYQPSFGEPISSWHRWFAWRPVETVDRGWRWLRPMWRRRIQKHAYLFGGGDFWFQHAIDVTPSERATTPDPTTATEQGASE